MKTNFTSPIWLQSAGSAGKAVRLFYVTSNANGNDIMFVNTKLGAFADNVQYSTDNAETWEQLTDETVITLDQGQTVYFRNYTGQTYNLAMSTKVLETSDVYSVGGDITALFYPRAKQLPIYAFKDAFAGDENLQDASDLILKSTSLAESCYDSMFFGCTGLTAAPELPATALAKSCYSEMFSNCIGLTAAPELPATALAESCYYAMFLECTGLTAAPELPATALAESCYSEMFLGCTSLTAITCLASSGIESATENWLGSVSDAGTFTKAAGVEWPTGASGIPDDWTVIEQ